MTLKDNLLVNKKTYNLPLFQSEVSAGFPSPADDYIEKTLDLNELLIKHPAATFFVRVRGDSMKNAGILSGDLLIVDRAIQAAHNHIVVAIVNGEFTVKRLDKSGPKVFLKAENPKYAPLEIHEAIDVQIWGVVIHAIHRLT